MLARTTQAATSPNAPGSTRHETGQHPITLGPNVNRRRDGSGAADIRCIPHDARGDKTVPAPVNLFQRDGDSRGVAMARRGAIFSFHCHRAAAFHMVMYGGTYFVTFRLLLVRV